MLLDNVIQEGIDPLMGEDPKMDQTLNGVHGVFCADLFDFPGKLIIHIHERVPFPRFFHQRQGDAAAVLLPHIGAHGKGRGAEDVDTVDLVVIPPVFRGFKGDVFLPKDSQQLLVGQRLGEIVALEPVAADAPEEIHLLLGLHALHQGDHGDILGHGDHGGDDPLGAEVHVRQEAHVDLQLVEDVILQGVEGGIAAAEIVHPDLIAGAAELLNDPGQDAALYAEGALGDLDVEHIARHPVFPGQGLDDGEHIRRLKVDAGEVHRDGDHRAARPLLPGIPLANFFHYMDIQVINLLGVLQRSHKLARRQKAEIRMTPAHQRLKSAEGPGNGVDDRLEIDLKLLVFNSLFQMKNEIVLGRRGLPLTHALPSLLTLLQRNICRTTT